MLVPFPSHEQLSAVCREMDAEIRALVAAQSSGDLNNEGFVERLLRFEAERARTHGLILTASHTFDDWTVVSLRIPGRSEPCASFEFQPATGRFRPVGTPCRERDPAMAEMVAD
jgi:hypothetical protein